MTPTEVSLWLIDVKLPLILYLLVSRLFHVSQAHPVKRNGVLFDKMIN